MESELPSIEAQTFRAKSGCGLERFFWGGIALLWHRKREKDCGVAVQT